MTVSYTTGGDSKRLLTPSHWAGQTFRVPKSFDLLYCDVDIYSFIPAIPAVLLLYNADFNHHPWGDCLSRDTLWTPLYPKALSVNRMRVKMERVTLHPEEYYCLLMNGSSALPPDPCSWMYDAGDATFPTGIRISSDDGRVTWDKHYGDDHIFCLFGEPPTPPPPPDPPQFNFAILDLAYELTPTGYILRVTTNIPCHLYMLWTVVEPRRHVTPIIRRGFTTLDASRYCFVVWEANKQVEPGDTTDHTFIKEPWAYCETRWFTFRAVVAQDWSASVGPIFKKHRYLPGYHLLISEPWDLDPLEGIYTLLIGEPWTS